MNGVRQERMGAPPNLDEPELDPRRNPGQWGAYNSTGHCVVLAGPGSGKTKMLSIKLARILAEDVREPHGVACITYNNECAKELEQPLDALGVEPSRRVFIGTVHSFSLTQIVLPYGKTAGMDLSEDFRVANQREQRGALEQACPAPELYTERFRRSP